MVVFLLALRDTVEVVVILDDDMKGFDDEDADCLGLLVIESKLSVKTMQLIDI